MSQTDGERGLHGRLVKTWEGTAGVNGLKLGGGQPSENQVPKDHLTIDNSYFIP